uniref:Uncharacterized protein n=1 Tax=Salix viminalis TaxID=40686 RepID=A0A6N2KMP9_SALVM
MVSAHVPCTTARAALLSSRASLERHLESKSWFAFLAPFGCINTTLKWRLLRIFTHYSHISSAAQTLFMSSGIKRCPIQFPLSSNDQEAKMVVEDFSMPALFDASS